MPRPAVVLVEDDESVAHWTARALLALGFVPRVFTGVEAASEALEAARGGAWPDAMLVDVDLPNIPGTVLVQLLIDRGMDPSETVVVLMTGYEMDGSVRHIAERLGVRAVLAKPFRRGALIQALGPTGLAQVPASIEDSVPPGILRLH